MNFEYVLLPENWWGHWHVKWACQSRWLLVTNWLELEEMTSFHRYVWAHKRARRIEENFQEVLSEKEARFVVRKEAFSLLHRLGRGGMFLPHTFGQFFNTDIFELFYLFHDKLLFIDLDNQRSTTSTSSCKTEFPKWVFDCLGDIDGLRLINITS